MSTVERKHSELVEWDGNPRPAASYETRTEMRASLAHTGQIMPLIGREKGNKVEIMGTRPLSKTKRWRLVRILEEAPRG